MKYCFLRYPGGKAKAVTFSYDDGVRHDLRLLETLNRYGIKCTLNLCSGRLGQSPSDSRLCPAEIQEHILDKGHEVAVHGKFHTSPVLTRPIQAIQDVLNCRLELEQTFDRIIRGMAYADTGNMQLCHNGTDYETIRQYLKDLGIVYARVTGDPLKNFRLPTDWLCWHPTARHADPNVKDLIKAFADLDVNSLYRSSRYPRLFTLWGHSFEFNNNQNWELLEELCEALGSLDDTWYATCMEIYEYVTAYDALVYSADCTKLYNPTPVKLWVDVDGVPYTIDPGQTITV